ncbi:MAG: SpoIIIAH-like family protein [Clostridium sp.]|nr:SpoIIIAH-like family protein [Clostridium sp.]
MTKKQLGIICTLLALIVCTALLALKLNNGGLNNPSDLSAALLTTDNKDTSEPTKPEFNKNTENKDAESKDTENKDKEDKDKETLNTTDFFYESRSEREQKEATTIQSLKSISENQNTSAEQKASATSELQKLTLRQDKQKTIELNIKNKGYDDALCEIAEDGSKANIIVKTVNGLNEKQGAEIQEIVQNASGIKEVSIEVKK